MNNERLSGAAVRRQLAILAVLPAAVLIACSRDDAATAREPIDGKAVYLAHCASCHEDGVDEAPQRGDQADWAARVPEWTELLQEHAARGFIDMQPLGGSSVLAPAAVAAAAAYLAAEVKPTAATGMNQDLTPGRATYAAYCGGCHDNGGMGAPRLGDDAAWADRSPFWESVLRSHVEDGFLAMPAKAGRPRLSDKDIAEAVEYMISWESIP